MDVFNNVVVVGRNGAIGQAFVDLLSVNNLYKKNLFTFSRVKPEKIYPHETFYEIDYENEEYIENAFNKIEEQTIDLVIVATGLLHTDEYMPEKSLKDLSIDKFQKFYMANAIFPALVGKHLLPKLSKEKKTIFAVISARVGSISDNYLGGWYLYRASKAALNMVLKNFSIELKRTHSHGVVVALHPGTVKSTLSEPFQKNVPEKQLFEPHDSVEKMLDVLLKIDVNHSGKMLDYNGQEILF